VQDHRLDVDEDDSLKHRTMLKFKASKWGLWNCTMTIVARVDVENLAVDADQGRDY
jgi:hypothetical protein